MAGLAAASAAAPMNAVSTRIMDVDREHRMCGLELPECAFRPLALLLSSSLHGYVIKSGGIDRLCRTRMP